MRQITKSTIALALILSLASCQSSKSGCYDFGEVNPKVLKKDTTITKFNLVFTDALCKP